jgi:hypothetical protein
MGEIDVDVGGATFDDRLADAYSRCEHPLCLCQAEGAPIGTNV